MKFPDDPQCPLPAFTGQGFAGFGTNVGNILRSGAEIIDGLRESMGGRIQLIGKRYYGVARAWGCLNKASQSRLTAPVMMPTICNATFLGDSLYSARNFRMSTS
jgi:hypothetical protein